MSKIHPTAIVDPSVRIGDDVEIGAYSIVEGDVTIGEGSVLRPHSILRRYTTLGAGNFVDSFAVLGGAPQDFKFDPDTVSYLHIGERNVFREGVTISRATGEGNATTVGNETFWMSNAHAGHNTTIKDKAILTNNVAVAGHSEIGSGAILSAYVGVHQFCWVGDMVMVQGGARITQHMPPYVMAAAVLNGVIGLNRIGLSRSPIISKEDSEQIREAFRITYQSDLKPADALEKMDSCADWGPAACKFRDFIRRALQAEPPFKRGLCRRYSRSQGE